MQKAYDACKRDGCQTVYYEDDEFTVRTYQKAVEVFRRHGAQARSATESKQLRRIKDAEEIRRVELACRISGEAFERVLSQIREGMTEKELARILEYDMLAHGADTTGFTTIVAAGANGSKPHAVPTDVPYPPGRHDHHGFRREGAGLYRGYDPHGGAGNAQRRTCSKVYEIVRKAQAMAQDAVKAGAACAAVDAVARDYIDAQGYEGRFGHGLGHSLGIDVHEEPRLSPLSKDVSGRKPADDGGAGRLPAGNRRRSH